MLPLSFITLITTRLSLFFRRGVALGVGALSVGFLALASVRTMFGQEYVFTTFAGAPGGFGQSDGRGSAARFHHPLSVAVDGGGNLFVADTNNHTIRKVTRDGVVTTFAGASGERGSADGVGREARFSYPGGVAVDGNGNVFVADYGSIRKITREGVVTTVVGRVGRDVSADLPSGFIGLAVDSGGTVFGGSGGAITKIGPDGVVRTFVGAAGQFGSVDGTGSAARFGAMKGLAADARGNLYVAQSDRNVGAIRKVTTAGVVTTLANLPGLDPCGVAVDGGGNVFVTFTWGAAILKIAPDGMVTPVVGRYGDLAGLSFDAFSQPAGIAVDGDGNLFVANSGHHNIRKIAPGMTTVFAGGAGFGRSDGVGEAARFNELRGIALDARGDLFVSDANNGIRKITADGFVRTVAGPDALFKDVDPFGVAEIYGLAVGARGDVFLAELDDVSGWLGPVGSRVRKINADGSVGTLAGSMDALGGADGSGGAALFNIPRGVAVNAAGDVFVADTNNHTIRKISPEGVVTTVSGVAKIPGGSDGDGMTARFNFPEGAAVDLFGNVFVADTGNHTIRRITAAGVASTLAGAAGQRGSEDGTGSAARFSAPRGLAVDSRGNVFVADTANHTIRRITPEGVVTTIAGRAGDAGSAEGAGSVARFNLPRGVAVGARGNLFVADSGNNIIWRGTPAVPVITLQPLSQSVARGRAAMLSVSAVGPAALAYQWIKDDTALPGATDAALILPGVNATHEGSYRCLVTTAGGSVASAAATMSVAEPSAAGRFDNFSVRASVDYGRSIVAGFVIGGAGPKSVLVRGVGPALGPFGVTGVLADPKLEIFASGGQRLGENDNWPAGLEDVFAAAGAFAFPVGGKDAALLLTLPPGAYTAVLSGVGGATGEALIEIHDVP